MNRKRVFLFVTLFAIATFAVAQNAPSSMQLDPQAAPMQRDQPSARSQERIQKEVRHELLMLPWFGVFDNISYKVDGYNVTLYGQVVRPSLKSDAENAVKHIEGVERVDNKIEVLPPSPMDDRLRIQLFHAIYGYEPLQKYALGVQKPIRIIVNNGHVTLEGVVDNEADKNAAGIRANGVPGIFSVTNNLQIVPS
ncbi:MAG: transport-associated protein [Acidobacteria bacterium]|jgi:hyperosmotically inducible protein|nr:MAG: transport-associated protein [Acidobacteriota bacterium]